MLGDVEDIETDEIQEALASLERTEAPAGCSNRRDSLPVYLMPTEADR